MNKVNLIIYPCAYRSARALRMLRYFGQRGYELHICTSKPQQEEPQIGKELGVGVKQYPIQAMLVPPWRGGMLKQAWRRAAFILQSAQNIREMLPDCVIASDIEGLIAAHIGKKPNMKVLYDIHDSTAFKFYRLPNLIVKLLIWIENRIVGSADAVIIVDSRRLSELPRRVAGHAHVVTIPNSSDDFLEKVPMAKRVAPIGKLQVCFCGMLIPQRGLEVALKMARQCNNIHLVVCGLARDIDIESCIRQNPNTTYLGNLPHMEALAQMKNSDVVLALYDPSIAGHRICAPNKVFESLMLGRPVIANRGTGLEQMVESNGIGYVIDYCLDGLIQACNKAYAERDSTLLDYARRARKVYECQYSWSASKTILDDLLRQLEVA